jgi:hypothetical protein
MSNLRVTAFADITLFFHDLGTARLVHGLKTKPNTLEEYACFKQVDAFTRHAGTSRQKAHVAIKYDFLEYYQYANMQVKKHMILQASECDKEELAKTWKGNTDIYDSEYREDNRHDAHNGNEKHLVCTYCDSVQILLWSPDDIDDAAVFKGIHPMYIDDGGMHYCNTLREYEEHVTHPFHRACLLGQDSEAVLYINNNEHVSTTDLVIACYFAVKYGHIDITNVLCQECDNSNRMHVVYAMLLLACKKGRVDIVKTILQCYYIPSQQETQRITHVAALYCKRDVFYFLIGKYKRYKRTLRAASVGGDLDIIMSIIDKYSEDDVLEGITLACKYNHTHVIDKLLCRVSDRPDIVDWIDYWIRVARDFEHENAYHLLDKKRSVLSSI